MRQLDAQAPSGQPRALATIALVESVRTELTAEFRAQMAALRQRQVRTRLHPAAA